MKERACCLRRLMTLLSPRTDLLLMIGGTGVGGE
jgi:hypothetical protein